MHSFASFTRFDLRCVYFLSLVGTLWQMCSKLISSLSIINWHTNTNKQANRRKKNWNKDETDLCNEWIGIIEKEALDKQLIDVTYHFIIDEIHLIFGRFYFIVSKLQNHDLLPFFFVFKNKIQTKPNKCISDPIRSQPNAIDHFWAAWYTSSNVKVKRIAQIKLVLKAIFDIANLLSWRAQPSRYSCTVVYGGIDDQCFAFLNKSFKIYWYFSHIEKTIYPWIAWTIAMHFAPNKKKLSKEWANKYVKTRLVVIVVVIMMAAAAVVFIEQSTFNHLVTYVTQFT